MKGLLQETETDPVFMTASRVDGIPGHGLLFRREAVNTICLFRVFGRDL